MEPKQVGSEDRATKEMLSSLFHESTPMLDEAKSEMRRNVDPSKVEGWSFVDVCSKKGYPPIEKLPADPKTLKALPAQVRESLGSVYIDLYELDAAYWAVINLMDNFTRLEFTQGLFEPLVDVVALFGVSNRPVRTQMSGITTAFRDSIHVCVGKVIADMRQFLDEIAKQYTNLLVQYNKRVAELTS